MIGETENTQEAVRPDRRRAFFLLFFSLMAIGAGNTMLIAAVLPPMTRELGLPDWMAGAIFSLSALCWSLFSPFWGKKSNQIGRRPIAAIGLAGYGVSMLMLLASGALALTGVIGSTIIIFACLALSRCVFGIIGSGSSPAAQAYVADRTSIKERQSEIAFVTSGFSVGTVVGPAFAATLVASAGLLSPLAVTAVIALTMAALIWFKLPENKKPITDAARKKADPTEKGLWRRKNVLPFLIFAICLSLASGILTQVFVFSVMDTMEVSGREAAKFTGPAFTIGAMAVLLAQLVLIPRLKLKNKTLMITGCIPLIIGSLLMVFAKDYAALVSAQFCIGLGQGLARPGFSSGASLAVSPQLQGNVAGLVISANGAGYVITPIFGLFVYEFVSPQMPFIFTACLLVFMCLYAKFGLADGVGEATETQDEIDPSVSAG
ncbi:MAG: MFS transporter [Hyphomonas sp.]